MLGKNVAVVIVEVDGNIVFERDVSQRSSSFKG